jgi:hypothetical protein
MYAFNIYKNIPYCPAQPSPVSLQVVANVTLNPVVNPMQIISNDMGKTLSTGTGQLTERLVPCRDVAVNYQEDMDYVPAGPVVNVSDPENRSRICLLNEDLGACVFEVRRSKVGAVNSISLLYNGTAQFTIPAYLAVSSSSVFALHIRRNLVQFQVDARTFYTFPQKLNFPFRLQFTPAGRDYSPAGFLNISTNFSDL